MVTYTVHERGGEETDIAARAEKIVFIKEGFAWLALVFPLVWLLYHRLWIVLAGFVVIITLLEVGVMSLGLNEAVAVFTTLALSAIFALQANDLRRWSLERKGFALADLVSAVDRSECERKFFSRWLAHEGAGSDPAPQMSAKSPKPETAFQDKPSKAGTGDDVIGLFPEPGR